MTTQEAIHGLSAAGLIRKLAAYSVPNGLSYAAWKLPSEREIMVLLSETVEHKNEISPESDAPGFAFAPFDPLASKLFLPATHLFRYQSGHVSEITNGDLLEMLPERIPTSGYFHQGPEDPLEEPSASFQTIVSEFISEIRAGRLQKAVASRCKKVNLGNDADPAILFEKLAESYPDAFVSLVSTPDGGTWIGASPEPLVALDRENIFRTVALAGTIPYREGLAINDVAWTQKEIEEQALVERYIIGCFKKIRVREYDEYGPKTVRAGNLLHLRTEFRVDQNEVRYPELATVMLKLMHPTSAVCGAPRDLALALLKEKEGYNRRYYAGYLGPVNIDQSSMLFVNLRCLKWMGNEALLFAGAGITAGSDPEQEWQETRFKLDTLRKFL